MNKTNLVRRAALAALLAAAAPLALAQAAYPDKPVRLLVGFPAGSGPDMVARLLAHRTLVMNAGLVVEAGLTDQVLDDPQHAYTQLLVSSALPA